MDTREYEAIGLRIRTVQRSLGLVDKYVAELLCIVQASRPQLIFYGEFFNSPFLI